MQNIQGQQVVVRGFSGQPLIRKVWEVTEAAVFVCTDKNFQRLVEGYDALWPVGFPREDVFQFDPEVLNSTVNLSTPTERLWCKLVPWSPESG